MDGGDHPVKKSLLRSASFSNSSARAAVPPPPPLSISRPSLLPHHWPGANPGPDRDSGSAGRRGQLAFFDRECSRVEDHLYLGSDLVARDRDALRLHGITHVLSCVGSPELFRPDLRYKTLWLSDTPSQDITSVLYDVFDYFEEVRRDGGGGRVLVHCSRGVSRSAALVVAYLMWRHELPFETALRRVRAARPVTDPNLGFASQLISFQNRILSCAASPSHWCRFYRMAPHSPYDPLHLVPKTLDRNPSPGDLDSRGAFVLQVPSAIYVWIGSGCDETMASSARAAASQIVKYEQAFGPTVIVSEGLEPSDFWNSYGSSLGNCDISGERTRKVKAYDLDFDIFLRATRDGILQPYIPPPVPESATLLPAKGGGWLRLKQRLLAGGVKDLVPCCSVPSLEDREVEPSGSLQSLLSHDSSNPASSSDFSSLSPASSSSDWCNSPSTGSEFYYEGELLLLSSRGGKSSPTASGDISFAQWKGWDSRLGEIDEQHDRVNDWPFSPLALAVEDKNKIMEIDYHSSLETDQMLVDEDYPIRLPEPALYRWPGLEQLENLHPGVLDSKSVFLLLAPESSLKNHDKKVLYLWMGSQSKQMIYANDEDDVDDQLQQIGLDFLNQKGFSIDTPIQVIREEEEPQKFLDYFFTFYQGKEKCHNQVEQDQMFDRRTSLDS